MSELSSTAAVGIEAVEWLDGGNGNLIVQVTGRWRRRRPVSNAQVTLIIESEGRRHRFPATPEPPSVGGTGPGMWRLSFSVPGWLAPALGGHTWLSLGTVTVPLPAPGVAGPGPEPAPAAAEPPAPLPPAPLPPAPPPTAPPRAGAPTEPPVPAAVPRTDELEHWLAIARSERDLLERSLADSRSQGVELERALSSVRSQQDELENALGAARSEREQLTVSLAEKERARRIAEQRAHAEQALRRDLARQLSVAEQETERAREAMGELAAAEDRIRRLERQLRDARRRSDEAEQAAAAAAARERTRAAEPAPEPPVTAPIAPGPVSLSVAEDSEAARVRFERRLRAPRADSGARVPAEPWTGLVTAPGPSEIAGAAVPEPQVVAPPPARTELPPVPAGSLVETLRRELDARAASEAALRSRVAAAETRLAARMLLERRTSETLGRLGEELESLRAALARERTRREIAERRAATLEQERRSRTLAERRVSELERELSGQRERSRAAHDAIGELRGALAPAERSHPPAPPAPAPAPADRSDTPNAPAAGPVQADRLSDALTRLRDAVAPPEPAAAGPPPRSVALTRGGRTLETAFRRLVKRDAPAAGELVLDLLTLQRAAYPHPIAYDLVLGPGRGCVRVTVGECAPRIERDGAARTRDEVDFRVQGEPARIARLMTAHGIWRRLGPRVARVRGRRYGLKALDALLTLPLDLAVLRDGGAALRPESVLALVSSMIEPAWTSGERFVIAHHDPDGRSTLYLEARDGKGLALGRVAPAGRVATTITATADALVSALTGEPARTAMTAQIAGDEGPLDSLRTWVKHAQRG